MSDLTLPTRQQKKLKLSIWILFFIFITFVSLTLIIYAVKYHKNYKVSALFNNSQKTRRNGTYTLSPNLISSNKTFDSSLERSHESSSAISLDDITNRGGVKIKNPKEVKLENGKLIFEKGKTQISGTEANISTTLGYKDGKLDTYAQFTNKKQDLISNTISNTTPNQKIQSFEKTHGLNDPALKFSTSKGLHISTSIDPFQNSPILSIFSLDNGLDKNKDTIPSTICKTKENIQRYKDFKARIKGKITYKDKQMFRIKNLPDICLRTTTFSHNRILIQIMENKYEYKFTTKALLKDTMFQTVNTNGSNNNTVSLSLTSSLIPSNNSTLQLTGSFDNIQFNKEYSFLNTIFNIKRCNLKLTISPSNSKKVRGEVTCEFNLNIKSKHKLNLSKNYITFNLNSSNKIIKSKSNLAVENKLILKNTEFQFNKNKNKLLFNSTLFLGFGKSTHTPFNCTAIGIIDSLTSYRLNGFCNFTKYSSNVHFEDFNISFINNEDTKIIIKGTIFILYENFSFKESENGLEGIGIHITTTKSLLDKIYEKIDYQVLKNILLFITKDNKINNIKAVYSFDEDIPSLNINILDYLKNVNDSKQKNEKILNESFIKTAVFKYANNNDSNYVWVEVELQNYSIQNIPSLFTNNYSLISIPFDDKIKQQKSFTQNYKEVKLSIGKFYIEELNRQIDSFVVKLETELKHITKQNLIFKALKKLEVSVYIFNDDVIIKSKFGGYDIALKLGEFIELKEIEFGVVYKNEDLIIKMASLNFVKDFPNVDSSRIQNLIVSGVFKEDKIILQPLKAFKFGMSKIENLVINISRNKVDSNINYYITGIEILKVNNITQTKPFTIIYPPNKNKDINNKIKNKDDLDKLKEKCKNSYKLDQIKNYGVAIAKLLIFDTINDCFSITVTITLFGKNLQLHLEEINVQTKTEKFVLFEGDLYSNIPVFKNPLKVVLKVPTNLKEQITIYINTDLNIFGLDVKATFTNLDSVVNPVSLEIKDIKLTNTFEIKSIEINKNNKAEWAISMDLFVHGDTSIKMKGSFNDTTKSWKVKGRITTETQKQLNIKNDNGNELVLVLISNPFHMYLETHVNIKGIQIKAKYIYDEKSGTFDFSVPVFKIGDFITLTNFEYNKDNISGDLSIGDCSLFSTDDNRGLFCVKDLKVDIKESEEFYEIKQTLKTLKLSTPFGFDITLSDIKLHIKTNKKLKQTKATFSGEGYINFDGDSQIKMYTKVEMEKEIKIHMKIENVELSIIELLESLEVKNLKALRNYFAENVSKLNITIIKTPNNLTELLIEDGSFLFYQNDTNGHLIASLKYTNNLSLQKYTGIKEDVYLNSAMVLYNTCIHNCSNNKEINEEITKLNLKDEDQLILKGKINTSKLNEANKLTNVSLLEVEGKVDILHPKNITFVMNLNNLTVSNEISISTNISLIIKDSELTFKNDTKLTLFKDEPENKTEIDLKLKVTKSLIMFYTNETQSLMFKSKNVKLLKLGHLFIDIVYNKSLSKFEKVVLKGNIPTNNKKQIIKASLNVTKERNGVLFDVEFKDVNVEDSMNCIAGYKFVPPFLHTNNKLIEDSDLENNLRNNQMELSIFIQNDPELLIKVSFKSKMKDKVGKDIVTSFSLIIEADVGVKKVYIAMFINENNPDLIHFNKITRVNRSLKNTKLFNGLLIFSYYTDIASLERINTKTKLFKNTCNYNFEDSSKLLSLQNSDAYLFVCFNTYTGDYIKPIQHNEEVSFLGYLEEDRIILSAKIENSNITKNDVQFGIERGYFFLLVHFNSDDHTFNIKINGTFNVKKQIGKVNIKGVVHLDNRNMLAELKLQSKYRTVNNIEINYGLVKFNLRENNKFLQISGSVDANKLTGELREVKRLTNKHSFDVLLYFELDNITPTKMLIFVRDQNFNFNKYKSNNKKSYVENILNVIKYKSVFFVYNSLGLNKEENSLDSLDTNNTLKGLKVTSKLSEFPIGTTFSIQQLSFLGFKGSATFRSTNNFIQFYCSINPIEIKLIDIPIIKLFGLLNKTDNFEFYIYKSKETEKVKITGSVELFGLITGSGVLKRNDLNAKNVWNFKGHLDILINFDLTMKIIGDDLFKPSSVNIRMFANQTRFKNAFSDLQRNIKNAKVNLKDHLNKGDWLLQIKEHYFSKLKSLYKQRADRILQLYRQTNISDGNLKDYVKLKIDIELDNQKVTILNKQLNILQQKDRDNVNMLNNIRAKINNVKTEMNNLRNKVHSRWNWFQRMGLSIGNFFTMGLTRFFDGTMWSLNFQIASAWVVYVLRLAEYYTLSVFGDPVLFLSKLLIKALAVGQSVLNVQSMEIKVNNESITETKQTAEVVLKSVIFGKDIVVKESTDVRDIRNYWKIVGIIMKLIVKAVLNMGKDIFNFFKDLINVFKL